MKTVSFRADDELLEFLEQEAESRHLPISTTAQVLLVEVAEESGAFSDGSGGERGGGGGGRGGESVESTNERNESERGGGGEARSSGGSETVERAKEVLEGTDSDPTNYEDYPTLVDALAEYDSKWEYRSGKFALETPDWEDYHEEVRRTGTGATAALYLLAYHDDDYPDSKRDVIDKLGIDTFYYNGF